VATPTLPNTITGLQAYQEAGADVLYAPGLADIDDIHRLASSVDRPVNVLVRSGLASVAGLAEAGVARISDDPVGDDGANACRAWGAPRPGAPRAVRYPGGPDADACVGWAQAAQVPRTSTV